MGNRGIAPVFIALIFIVAVVVIYLMVITGFKIGELGKQSSEEDIPKFDPMHSEYQTATFTYSGNSYNFQVNGISFEREEQMMQGEGINIIAVAMFRDIDGGRAKDVLVIPPPDNNLGTYAKPMEYKDDEPKTFDLVFDTIYANKQLPAGQTQEFLFVTFWAKSQCIVNYLATTAAADEEIADLVTTCPTLYLSSMNVIANRI